MRQAILLKSGILFCILILLGCKSYQTKDEEYFYYYNSEKIFLNLIGTRDGNLVFAPLDDPASEMILTDEFIIKLKPRVDLKQLESLNQKYKVQKVKNILYSDDEFILKVTPESKMNSLDMANTYHEESIIQWSEPNLIREYDLGKS